MSLSRTMVEKSNICHFCISVNVQFWGVHRMRVFVRSKCQYLLIGMCLNSLDFISIDIRPFNRTVYQNRLFWHILNAIGQKCPSVLGPNVYDLNFVWDIFELILSMKFKWNGCWWKAKIREIERNNRFNFWASNSKCVWWTQCHNA